MSNVIIIPTVPVGAPTMVNPYQGMIDNTNAQDPPVAQSTSLGTPLYQTFEFVSGQYLDNNNNVISFPGIILENVLVQVQQRKNVVRTFIQGAPGGSVKEYIADGDYEIFIRGVIPAYLNNVRATGSINLLQQILLIPVAIQVNNVYLTSFGIDQVVVYNIELPQDTGGYSQQPFTIQAWSDTPVQLQINSNNSQ